MKIASKVGIVLAAVGMTIGLMGAPAQARDSSWDSKTGVSAKYIP
jgi:hypothetical protein